MNELSEYPKIIKISLQNRHIRGTKEYSDGNSYLNSNENPQSLLDELSNTGVIKVERGNKKEYVRANRIIEVAQTHDGSFPTHEAKIHYSSSGAHIVPRKERDTWIQ